MCYPGEAVPPERASAKTETLRFEPHASKWRVSVAGQTISLTSEISPGSPLPGGINGGTNQR